MNKILTLFICFAAAYSACGSELRIVSLSPALTEMVCYLGGEKALVGRSSACDYPASIRTLPAAGKFGMPEIEKIVALKPDWVIGNSFANNNAVKKLRQWSIKVNIAQISNMDDYLYWVRLIGKKLNAPQQAIQAEKELLQEKEFLQSLPPLKLKVLWVVNAKPLIVAGKGSLPDNVLKLIKAENAVGNVEKEYFKCSAEFLASSPVDLIIWNVPSSPEKSGRFFQKLSAVRLKRVVYLNMDDPIVRPGPRFMKSVKALRKKVERFAGEK